MVFYGPHTKETRKRMSESHKGKSLSEGTKEKISQILKGRVRSEEHCKNLSKAEKVNSQVKTIQIGEEKR